MKQSFRVYLRKRSLGRRSSPALLFLFPKLLLGEGKLRLLERNWQAYRQRERYTWREESMERCLKQSFRACQSEGGRLADAN